MDKLVLKYNPQFNFYTNELFSDLKITHLGNFLTDDVGCRSVHFYKDWLNNPDDIEGGGNYSHLEKHDNKITIAFEYDWFHDTPGAEVFETTIAELNHILDRWQEACEKKPKRIIITRDQGKVTVDFED